MKAKVLSDTSKFLSSISKKEENTITDLEFTFYILAKEFGITKTEEYPLPYLNGLINTYNYLKELEHKASKRKQNG